MNLALIPARGGSKRIPRKNMKPFLGKPILQYSIDLAKSAGLFDEVTVSTEDIEIEDFAAKHGVKAPFRRSEKNANDFATLSDVLLEVLTEYQKLGMQFANVCVILPTAPLITNEILNEAYRKLVTSHFSAVIPLVKYSHPIQRALKVLNNSGKTAIIDPKSALMRTQDCAETYYDSGQFYWINVKQFLIEKKILMENAGSIELMPEQCHDIDSMNDWVITEMKYKLLYSQYSKMA